MGRKGEGLSRTERVDNEVFVIRLSLLAKSWNKLGRLVILMVSGQLGLMYLICTTWL